MLVVTDIAFEHDTMSGKTRITVTKQVIAPHEEWSEWSGTVKTIIPVGEPTIEEITIGP